MRFATLAVALTLALPAVCPAQSPARSPAQSSTGDDLAAEEKLLKEAKLTVTGAGLLDFFKKRSTRDADGDRIKQLIKDLGDRGDKADKASEELVKLGMNAVPLLRQAANDADEADASARARACLQAIEGESGAALSKAATHVLVRESPAGTVEALLAFLPFAEDEKVAIEIEKSLVQLVNKAGKLDAALLKALEDKVPIRRALAAQVVCESGTAEQRKSVVPLLKDARPTVRFRAAIGLARRSDAEAIPVLIDSLEALPPEMGKQCEEFLTELAGEWKITVPAGNDLFLKKLRREAWMAWWKATEGKVLIEELQSRTLTNAEREKALDLVAKLDTKEKEKDAATAALVGMGAKVVPLLRRANLEANANVAAGLSRVLGLLDKEAPATLPVAAVRLLALRKPEGAGQALLTFVPFADGEELIDAVLEALPALAVEGGKPSAVFVKALADPVASRRIAAAQALTVAGADRESVRGALKDKDPEVRLNVALALAGHADKEAVPVLIASLAEAPTESAWKAEEMLTRIAGDKKPSVSLGSDDTARKAARKSWEEWWKENGAGVKMVKQDFAQKTLGYTAVVEQYSIQGNGRVVEFDSAGKKRWEVTGLSTPMDAQVLSNERVLITEYGYSRVSERDTKTGNIVWQKSISSPIAATRLRNGTTFVACRYQIVELDRKGDITLNLSRPSDYMYAAARLKDGTFGIINSAYQYVHIDRKNNELKRIQVPMDPVGGSRYFEVTPQGTILCCYYNGNKVVEYDREGKVLWSASNITLPYMATKLSNGHTLVTSQSQPNKVVEFDRTGKQVRELTDGNNLRPYKANRR